MRMLAICFGILVALSPVSIADDSKEAPSVKAAGYRVIWDKPEVLAEEAGGTGRTSWVAVDKQGNVFVFWNSIKYGEGYKTLEKEVKYRRWDGKSWSNTEYFSNRAPGSAMLEGLCSDSEGNIHIILWEQDAPGGTEQPLRYRKWDGERWSEHAPAYRGYGSALCCDHTGLLHLVYEAPYLGEQYLTQGTHLPIGIAEPGKLFYKAYDGNSWTEAVRLNKSGRGARFRAEVKSVAVDHKGILHLMWIRNDIHSVFGAKGREGGLYYQSAKGGKWTTPVKLGAISSSYGFSMCCDSTGNVHVVGRFSSSGLSHRIMSEGKWTSASPVTRGLHDSALCADSRGRVHLVSGGQPYHRMWDGTSWSEWVGLFPELETALEPHVAREPHVTIDPNDNLYLTWSDCSLRKELTRLMFVRGKIVRE